MILEYFRPKSIPEAIALITRQYPQTIPLAGGSTFAKRLDDVAVVDLQSLSLNYINLENGMTRIGATTTLDAIVNAHQNNIFIVEPVKIQLSKNQRMTGTLGGLICSANGRSPVLTALLALDASITVMPGKEEISLENWLPKRDEWTKGKLVTEINIPADLKCAFESIARSPLDQPIVCCAVAKEKTGSIRLVVGGFGPFPKVIFAGDVPENLDSVIETQLVEAVDEWSSAEYRIDVSKKLATRLINSI